MSKFELKIDLIQQTPMIHFQCDEPGACLRASEVKPKLDRFIHDWIDKQNEKIVDKDDKILIPDAWYINKKEKESTSALNYKMKIIVDGNSVEKSIMRKTAIGLIEKDDDGNFVIKTDKDPSINRMYFGNKVSKGILKSCRCEEEVEKKIYEQYKESVFHTSVIKVKITSLIKEKINLKNAVNQEVSKIFNCTLIQLIESLSQMFFKTHNFGMRQSKGFGSFHEIEKTDKKPLFTVSITDFYPIYFVVKYEEPVNYKKVLKDIWIITGLMKSGFNLKGKKRDVEIKDYYKGYSLRYLRKDNYGNDKAFIKQKIFISNRKTHRNCKLNTECTKKEQNDEQKFIRAMLGLPGFYEFKDTVRYGKVGITHDCELIERFASPILFKLNDNKLHIFPKIIPDIMFDTSFKFDLNDIPKDSISTPKESMFNLIDFLTDFSVEFDQVKNSFKNSKLKCTQNIRIKRFPENEGAEKNE